MIRNSLLQIGACAMALASLAWLGGCKDTAASGGDTKEPAASGGGATATGDVIKIGLVASQGGDLRPWGQDCIAGARLAEAEINAAGGIGGKKIQLIVEDSNSKPEEGKSAAEKLASEGVIGLVGEVASGITLQMKTVAMDRGLPLIAVGATNPDVTKDSNGLVSRVCYTDDVQGPVMAFFAYNDLKLRKVAIMTDNKQPYSQGLSASFAKRFKELGGEIVGEEFYQSGENQFGGQLTSIKSKNPDGIFMSGYFTEVGPMARQIRQQGMTNVKLMGGDGWDSTELTSSGGDAIVGGYFCNHYNNAEDRPEVQDFLKKFREANNGNDPGTTMAALGYDATMLMIDALKRMDAAKATMDSATLAKTISETVDFPGVSGKITLQGMNGDPEKRALVVQVTKTGQEFVKAYEPSEVVAK
ncbi:MAG: ABC transporter substrate-binding protein [Armatimonadetes bacterium]|nr:ABC transporter substrate-binding protein [Armatimonadota bacterium]